MGLGILGILCQYYNKPFKFGGGFKDGFISVEFAFLLLLFLSLDDRVAE